MNLTKRGQRAKSIATIVLFIAIIIGMYALCILTDPNMAIR